MEDKDNDQHKQTNVRQIKYIDLLPVFREFRTVLHYAASCEGRTRKEVRKTEAGDITVDVVVRDEIFEQQLAKLNALIREWWIGYKQDWRLFYP